MDLSNRVLGSHTVNQLRTRAASAVLRIGSDSFTRADLAGVDCYNYQAAANLSAVLSRELRGGVRVRNTKDVYEMVSPELLASMPRLGAISLAVLGAAFESKGLGGDAALEAWAKRHFPSDKAIVTFDTMKHRDQAEHADERRREKARKASRRNTAHETRVGRFIDRQAAADNT